MQEHTDEPTPRKAAHIFSYVAITSLLIGIAITFIQKGHESAAAVAGATDAGIAAERNGEQNNVRKSIDIAGRWQLLSLTAVLLGMLSWGAAIWRREKHCWGSSGDTIHNY